MIAPSLSHCARARTASLLAPTISLTAETHELDVRCIDSRTGSGAEGLLVEYALAMHGDGRSLDETEAQIRATLPNAHLLLHA